MDKNEILHKRNLKLILHLRRFGKFINQHESSKVLPYSKVFQKEIKGQTKLYRPNIQIFLIESL